MRVNLFASAPVSCLVSSQFEADSSSHMIAQFESAEGEARLKPVAATQVNLFLTGLAKVEKLKKVHSVDGSIIAVAYL